MDMTTMTTIIDNMTSGNQSGMPRRPQPQGDPYAELFRILTTVAIAIGMVGIGCSVDYKILWRYMKNPRAYLIGVLLQLVLLPPLAWALTKIFQMPSGEAIGVMIQGSSPGGTTSNLVVYYMGGEVDLSVAMTGTSTLLALGTMPFWLFVYDTAENLSSEFTIPYDQLAITLALIVGPVFIGMLIFWKFPEKSPLISKIIVVFATIALLAVVVASSIVSQIPWVVTWRQGVVAAIMPFVAYALGFLITLLPFLKLNTQCKKTISVEVALQNTQVAVAIIQISFRSQLRILIQSLLFPILYLLFQLGYSVLFVALFYFYNKRYGSTEDATAMPESRGQDNPGFETIDLRENGEKKEKEK